MTDTLHKSQVEIAIESVTDSLRKFQIQAFLGISDQQMGTIFNETRSEILAVDVSTVGDERILSEFITKSSELLTAIRRLNAHRE